MALISMFSPPYGDCTFKDLEEFWKRLFSPPYEDRTEFTKIQVVTGTFSPP